MILRRRPRLLVVASTYPRWKSDPEPGFVHELAKRLTPWFDVTVLCPHAPGALRHERLDGVDVWRFRYAPTRLQVLVNNGGIVTNLRRSIWKFMLVPGFLVGLVLATRRLVNALQPHVAHAHWLVPQGLVLAVLRLLDERTPPFVVTSHGADLYALRAAPWAVLKGFVARRAEALTVVSEAMAVEVARMTSGAVRASVQPMGADLLHRFTPDLAVKRSHDEILFVGRLVEKKGLGRLIDAMPAILKTKPSAFLSVVGFGPEEAERREQVRCLGLQDKVRFLGPLPQEHLPAIYRRAALLVAPFVKAQSGDQEGLGLVVVEALGCGCPLIVGNVPAVADLLPEQSPNVVDASHPESIASAVARVLSDPESAREQAARLRAATVERFDWMNVAKRYAELLESVAGLRTV
ncbi:glycosyltransferase family 4 protein [uncultured Luteimonas sp.]|uniref:glycosyltransferase family 4 protein n=1 Tax=uncultured Luteimonas sp. TaxID=453144 RepID=UPI0026336B9F|nr:glycosyltransferase family 4 protein [uncultured Luteimonas sp.]